MKNIFRVKLKCPFCGHEFLYNILSFKAKHECSNCEYGLIVRTKATISTILSIPGFFLIVALRNVLGISQWGRIFQVVYVLVAGLFYIGIVYKFVCLIKTPSFLYHVDMEDPTVLLRKKNRK